MAAALLPERAVPPADGVRTGIDVLARDNFAALKGRRVGLVTNHTGLDREGRATIDLLFKAEGVTLLEASAGSAQAVILFDGLENGKPHLARFAIPEPD